MANPGIGYRTAADVLMEVSFHLSQPTVYTSIVSLAASGFGAGGFGAGGFGGGGGSSAAIEVQSTYAMYPGALVIVGWNTTDAEVVEVLTVTDGTHFTCILENAHSIGEIVLGPTFPTQEATDPLYTQDEMLSYLARAQNEFLTAVPSYYQRFFQDVEPGGLYQDTPNTALLIDRIAASSLNMPITSITRAATQVTLITAQPTFLVQYNTFSVFDSADETFDGVFAVIASGFVGDETGYGSNPGGYGGGGYGGDEGGYYLVYRQVGDDASVGAGGFVQSMLRLYELTQQELTMRDRFWKANYTPSLRNWFEDRSGLYKWGVGGLPAAEFPVELLCAVRDSDTLGLLDGFLVPDLCMHYVKYLAMSFAWSKEGVNQQPQMADFCFKRYTQGVMATQRYIRAMEMEMARA